MAREAAELTEPKSSVSEQRVINKRAPESEMLPGALNI